MVIRQFFVTILLVAGLLSFVHAASIDLTAEQNTVSLNESFRVYLKITMDNGESAERVTEPSFPHLAVQHRGESQSSSFNMINGSTSYSKNITYTYVLLPEKPGAVSIGPAKLTLENGKTIASGTLSVTVSDAGGTNSFGGTSGTAPPDMDSSDSDAPKNGTRTANDLRASLSPWEKRTPNHFIRTIISPDGDIYRGEPVTVSYYLFTRRNGVNDVGFYKLPNFRGSWKDDAGSPRRLRFNRVRIDNTVYDYALLKRYVVIPGEDTETLSSTQLILNIQTGGFFTADRKRIASVALNVPLSPLPEADTHPDSVYGNFSLNQDTTSVTLRSGKLLDDVTYTITGCGNLQSISMPRPDVPGLSIFAPDVNSGSQVRNGKYCGKKQFTFIFKGTAVGTFTIPPAELTFFDRERGYYTLSTRPVTVPVKEAARSSTDDESSQKKAVTYEFLRELPSGVSVLSLTPITERSWFIILLMLPVAAIILSSIILLITGIRRRYRKGRGFQHGQWEKKIKNADNVTTLINTLYGALADTYDIHLRGMREKEIRRNSRDDIIRAGAFLTELQHAAFAGPTDINMTALRKQAVEIFNTIGRKK